MKEPQKNRKATIKKITKNIPQLITKEHNETLMREISMEEMDQAIMEMPKDKSPDPNGFTTDLFHVCW